MLETVFCISISFVMDISSVTFITSLFFFFFFKSAHNFPVATWSFMIIARNIYREIYTYTHTHTYNDCLQENFKIKDEF